MRPPTCKLDIQRALGFSKFAHSSGTLESTFLIYANVFPQKDVLIG